MMHQHSYRKDRYHCDTCGHHRQVSGTDVDVIGRKSMTWQAPLAVLMLGFAILVVFPFSLYLLFRLLAALGA